MKALLTRAGPGTKMVCLGNVEQIDTRYLTETTSGLTFAVDRFKQWEHAGQEKWGQSQVPESLKKNGVRVKCQSH